MRNLPVPPEDELRRVFGSEFILVTEHGWRDFMTDCAGRQPALVNSPVRG